MKKTLHPIWIALLLCMTGTLVGQNQMEVLLRTGTTFFPDNAREYVSNATISSEEMVEGHYYRLLQFHALPNQAQLDQLAAEGLELLEYIPHHTYLASIPTSFQVEKLPSLGVRSIQTLNRDLKMSDELKSGDIPRWSSAAGNQVLAMLKFHKNLKHEDIQKYCQADGIKVLTSNGINNFLRTSFSLDRIEEVAALPYVAFLELVPAPDVKDDILGRSLHRSNMIDSDFASGRHYNGDGVNILCRDDGTVGPHIDFTGRIDNFDSTPGGTHGDGVSGIMCGSGNLNPRFKGMADHAFLYVTDYQADFLDATMSLHIDNDVLVTNSSYSNGCNAGYTEITETVDQQLYDNPTLLHVFSAGNSNNNECGYGAGNQWGNITGGHKQAKNCITTANLINNGTITGSSSRGPAHDGRIKPDISAHGTDQISTDPNNEYQTFGGTSAASPGIAGITAQLHQAYRELNGGEIANAALLKAIMLTTANDLGNVGPDFIFGWGHVNAYRSVLALEENRYFKSSVDAGATNTHQVSIPDGVLQARLMVYWADPEASVMTSKALVNNIDIWATDANGTETRPWILNPAPNPNTLDDPATKGVDDLNNMEQVSLDNPEAGEYTLHVQGTELPFGNHEYYVVWEFRTEEITLTHPNGGEGFDPGEELRIHWDAYKTGSPFDLSYSTDNGASWNPIQTVPSTAIMHSWTVPNEVSGEVLVRVKRNGFSDTNDEVFSIAPRVDNMVVTQACPDYIRVEWDPIDLGTASTETSYELFVLGDKYMESVGVTNGNTFDVPTSDPSADNWIAIKTLGDNGIESERTIAMLYNNGLLDCTLQLDLELTQVLAPGTGSAYICGSGDLRVKVELFNNGMEPLSDFDISYSLNGGPLVTETFNGTVAAGETIEYEFTEVLDLGGQMDNQIEVFTTTPGDEYEANNIEDYTFSTFNFTGTPASTDYAEDFDGGAFPPSSYFIGNPDNGDTWIEQTVTGSDGNSTNAAAMINYFYNSQFQEDDLFVIPISLVGATAATLSFDLAYAPYSATLFDGLRIEIAECGGPFNNIVYEKYELELATVGSYLTGAFSPGSADDWRNESIDLSAFEGKEIVIKFVNINNWGNNLYIDNINVFSLVAPTASFDASSTQICQGETVTFTSTSTGSNIGLDWNFGNGASPSNSSSADPVTVTFNEAGSIDVMLDVSNAAGTANEMQTIQVDPLPVPGFDVVVDGFDVTFTNTSEFSDSYFWVFGDMGGSVNANPTHTYTENGVYTVVLSGTNDCGTVDYSFDVTINVSSVNELAGRLSTQLLPNPSNGQFLLTIDNDRIETLEVEVLDVRGVSYAIRKVNTNVGTSTISFDHPDLAPGMYLLKIVGEDGYKALKMIIE